MRRVKTSRWGRKKSTSSTDEATVAAAKKADRVPLRAQKVQSVKMDGTDYGRFYDKINARGMCDDLVLLENVSNEGIVEVFTRDRYWETWVARSMTNVDRRDTKGISSLFIFILLGSVRYDQSCAFVLQSNRCAILKNIDGTKYAKRF